MKANELIAQEILEIMRVYHHQDESGFIDTPGGLEHMGDVWQLFKKWEKLLKEGVKMTNEDTQPQEKKRFIDLTELEFEGRYLGDVYAFHGKPPYFAPAPDDDYVLSVEEIRAILKATEKPNQEYLDGLAEKAAERDYLGDGIFADNH